MEHKKRYLVKAIPLLTAHQTTKWKQMSSLYCMQQEATSVYSENQNWPDHAFLSFQIFHLFRP